MKTLTSRSKPVARKLAVLLAMGLLLPICGLAQPVGDHGINIPAVNQVIPVLNQSVLHLPHLTTIYWHNRWDATTTQNTQFTQARVDAFIKALLKSNYLGAARQYLDRQRNVLAPVTWWRSYDTAGVALPALWAPAPGTATNFAAIHAWTAYMMTFGVLHPVGAPFGTTAPVPPPLASQKPDELYLVLLPEGTNSINQLKFNLRLLSVPGVPPALITSALPKDWRQYFDVSAALVPVPGVLPLVPGSDVQLKIDVSANSGERFSAYHAWTINPPPFKLRSAYLIVFADVAAKSASDASTFYTPFDELTYLISHELIEAVTDPFVPFGWNDMSGGLLDVFLEGEMADIAAKTPSPDKRMVWYNGMVVAGYWSNRHKDVVAGSGVARRLTFKANFVSERNPPNVSVPVKIDTRTAKLLPANVFTFDLLVVDGTTHSYEYPQDVGDPSTGTTYYAYVPTNKRQGRVERDLNIAVDYTTLHYVEVTTKPAAVAERADIALTESGWKDAGPQQLTAPRTVRIGGVTYRFLEWRSVSGPVVRATTPNVNYNLTGPLKVMAIYVRR